jgi:hypothetical protein
MGHLRSQSVDLRLRVLEAQGLRLDGCIQPPDGVAESDGVISSSSSNELFSMHSSTTGNGKATGGHHRDIHGILRFGVGEFDGCLGAGLAAQVQARGTD